MRKSLFRPVFRLTAFFLLVLLSYLQPMNVQAAGEPQPINASELALLLRKDARKIKLVNIWATWCPPCIKEFPDIVNLQKELGPSLQLILINSDAASEIAEAKKFLEAQKLSFVTYRQNSKDQEFIKGINQQLDWQKWPQAQWSGALPATFIFDEKGTLHYFWEGELPLAECKTQLKALMSKSNQPKK